MSPFRSPVELRAGVAQAGVDQRLAPEQESRAGRQRQAVEAARREPSSSSPPHA